MLMSVLAVRMTEAAWRGGGAGRPGTSLSARLRGGRTLAHLLTSEEVGALTPRTADLRPKGGPATQVGRAATSRSGGAEMMSFPPVSTLQFKIVL